MLLEICMLIALGIICKDENIRKMNVVGEIIDIIIKSKGPRMLPWGTPDNTGSSSDTQLFIRTHWYHPVRYGKNHPQLKRSTRGVNHTRVGFFGSIRVYTHTQYLHTHAYPHAVFTFACVFTRLHACMANVASMLASCLSTS